MRCLVVTFYIAGSFKRGPSLIPFRDALITQGHRVTSNWLERSLNPDTWLSEADAAREDIYDINRSNVLIHFTEKPDVGYMTGGRHWETGYAWGIGKQIIFIGPRENVFHFLPNQMQFDTAEEFLAELPSMMTTFSLRQHQG